MNDTFNQGNTQTTTTLCGAHTRSGGTCQKFPIAGKKRCRNHGGLSTGPKTREGRQRTRQSRLIHGRYSKTNKEQRQIKQNLAHINATLNRIEELLVGLGKQKLTTQQLDRYSVIDLVAELMAIYKEVRAYAFRIMNDENASTSNQLRAISQIINSETSWCKCLKVSGFIDWKFSSHQMIGNETRVPTYFEEDLVELWNAVIGKVETMAATSI